ncbi:MAG: cellulase, partial [Bacteroidetes bacterium]|nr:cellulase [Bacteroidota bacterium]
MFKRFFTFFAAFVIGAIVAAYGQSVDGTHKIRLNQVGFYPEGPKIAVVLGDKGGSFSLQPVAGKAVFRGVLKKSLRSDLAGNYTWIADFSSFTTQGKYVL